MNDPTDAPLSRPAPAVWAIVPARGGSKGLPGKNMRLLGGRPLITHVLTAALACPSISRVIVSTDDDAIAAAAAAAGAGAVRRPPELATDEASSESALLHALDVLQAAGARPPELIAFLQCTSPLTLSAELTGAVVRSQETGADCVFAAIPFHGFVWREDAAGEVVSVNHDGRVRERRQDRPDELLETGAFYILRTETFRRAGHRFCGRTLAYRTDPERHIDIDTRADFDRAQELFQRFGGGRGTEAAVLGTNGEARRDY